MNAVYIVSLLCLLFSCTSSQKMPELGKKTSNIEYLIRGLGLTTLDQLLQVADLAETFRTAKGPFTLFGPTNTAFMALPKPVLHILMTNKTALKQALSYHALSGAVFSSQLSNELLVPSLAGPKLRVNIYQFGKVITISGSHVTMPDRNASNGVVHVLNKVIWPIPTGTVVDVVKSDTSFSTLLKAVSAANLASVLSGAGPFTVFAPTDEAFSKLPKGALDNLLKNVTALTEVLKYHVVSGTFYSAGLLDKQPVPTLNGKCVTVHIKNGNVMVQNANVVTADVSVTNGVIHIIDEVLLPSSTKKMDVLDEKKVVGY